MHHHRKPSPSAQDQKPVNPPPTPKTPKTRAPIADFFFENLA